MVARDIKYLTIVNKEFYCRGSGGPIARSLSIFEAKEELQRVHELSCIDKDINLYICLKGKDTIGSRWPRKLSNLNVGTYMGWK